MCRTTRTTRSAAIPRRWLLLLTISLYVDTWDHVIKRKHALDKGEAIMPVHGRELRQCTSPLEVNCLIL
jgi:hypothetical protein